MIVAIDGEAGAGKTTVSAAVAGHLGCSVLESGSIYRALAWKALEEGIDPSDEESIIRLIEETSMEIRCGSRGSRVFIGARDVTENLREPRVGEAASAVASIHGVRQRLMPLQKEAAGRGDLVAEGRDMGTVVFPGADHKFFLKASLDVRTERRRQQLGTQGRNVSSEAVRKEVRERDERDAGREWSPMKAASDAVVIDTSDKDIESVVGMIMRQINLK